jgi:hypothetical protein
LTWCQGDDVTSGLPDGGCVTHLLLLSTTREVVDEVDGTLRSGGGAMKPKDQGCLAMALWAVGNALALREPHVGAATATKAALLLAFNGAAAALRFGWPATLAACTELLACTLAAAAEGTVPPRGAASGAILMHQAAVRGCPLLAGQLLGLCSPDVTGTAVEADASGSTPLHIAAAAGHASLLVRLCVEGGDALAGATATVAFFTALDAAGRTPSQLAAGHGELRQLVEQLRARVALGAGVLHSLTRPLPTPSHASWAHLRRLEAQLTRRSTTHSGDAESLAAALVASLLQAGEEEACERVPAQATSLLMLSALVAAMYSTCLISRHMQGMLSEAEARRALVDSQGRPSWPMWQRMPFAMCASPTTMPLLWTARTLLCFSSLLLGLVATLWRRRCCVGRLAPPLGSALTAMHLILLSYVLLLDPACTARAMHTHFGGTGLLRRPWPGAVVTWLTTGASHLASNGVYRQQRVYASLFLARGAAPLLARVVGNWAAPPWLAWLASAKIADLDIRNDLVHAAMALLAVAHARWTQRRGRGRQAQAKQSPAAGVALQ